MENETQVHQRVLNESAQSYLKVATKENILTNPNGLQQNSIHGRFPDIIVKFPSGEIILEEIETESTVTEQSAKKWQDLANLGYEVRVVVPLTKIDIAKRLAGLLANINIQAYDLTSGQIKWFGKN